MTTRSIYRVRLDYEELARRVSERLGKVYDRQYCYDILHGFQQSKRVSATITDILSREPKPTIPLGS